MRTSFSCNPILLVVPDCAVLGRILKSYLDMLEKVVRSTEHGLPWRDGYVVQKFDTYMT